MTKREACGSGEMGIGRRVLGALWCLGALVLPLACGPGEVKNGSGDEVSLEMAPPRAESAASESEIRPHNVILFVADGMGFAHLGAARAALHGIDGAAAWDRFPITGWQRSHPTDGFLIDSAASATAMAIGSPSHNGTVGLDAAGEPRETLFERGAELGYRTGIVTDSYIWDATPAAFATHVNDRDNAAEILRQLSDSSLEVLFGELEDLGEDGVPEWEPSIAMLQGRFQVAGPAPDALAELPLDSGGPIAAIFEEDQVTDLESTPTLPALITGALRRLSSDQRPFLLLVESEEPDSASHKNDFQRLLRGMEAIEASLEVVLDFAEEDGRTLVVFTSDHETGGLALSITGRDNHSLRAIWPTDGHTGVPVPVFALGPGAEHFSGSHSNAETGRLLSAMLQVSES